MHESAYCPAGGRSIGGITYIGARDSTTCSPSAKVQIGLRPVQRCKSERPSFRVAGGGPGWQVAAPAGRWRGMLFQVSGLGCRFRCGYGSGARRLRRGRPMAALLSVLCHRFSHLFSPFPHLCTFAPSHLCTCSLPWPSPLCLPISARVVISSGRSPWERRCSRSQGLSLRR